MDGGGFQQGRALSSEELLSIMEAAAGRQFETYTYVDMNHDGAAELIGTYCGDRERYTTWYCSSDGSICKLVHQMMIGWTAVSLNCWTWGRKPMWF